MKKNQSNLHIRLLQWQVVGISALIISLLVVFIYIYRGITLLNSILGWVFSILLAWALILFSFQRIRRIQNQLDQVIEVTEQQAQRDAALAQLSGGFAAIHTEEAVCQELVERLFNSGRYDHIAVFLLDTPTGNRILRAEKIKENIHPTPVLRPGEGLSERPLFDLKPYYTTDVSKEPNYAPGLGVGSEIDIPIAFDGKLIGVIVVESSETNAYDQYDIEILSIVAEQAAIAIENARLFQNTKDLSDRQEVLHQVSQAIIRTGMDLEQIYQAVHQAAARLMPADAFVICILTETQDEIEAAYLWDKNKRNESQRIPRGSGLSWHVIETGEPVLAYDYYKQEELESVSVIHFGNEDHIRSVLAVPMRLSGKVIGMISAQSYQAHYYSNEDQRILDMLAAYAAIAIDNARLFSEVQRLAITDSLTGVYNRRHFFEIAQHEIFRARRYQHAISIIMLDLDYYKNINDTYGHDIGDHALKIIAEFCRRIIRKSDVLARYGGDEFIVLLPETNLSKCQEIAERLRQFLENEPIVVDEKTLRTTISVGISGAEAMIPDLHLLLKCADVALYDAKEAGRNCVRIQECPLIEIAKEEKTYD